MGDSLSRMVVSGMTTYPSGEPPVLSGVLVARALVVCSVFCRSLIALLFFFLLAIAFFDLPILITPLVSSNASVSFIDTSEHLFC
jgi:hypothetical protein